MYFNVLIIYMPVLDKLKIKPTPQKFHKIGIKIQEPSKEVGVAVKTKVVDKRHEKVVDHDRLLSKIRKKSNERQTTC